MLPQGIVVATLYCFLSKEVREAIRREYRRYSVKRSAAASTNGLSNVASIRDRRRSVGAGRRSISYYGNQTTNSVYCCEQTADNAPYWHSFHRRASSFFLNKAAQNNNKKTLRGAGNNRIKSISGSKQGLPLHTVYVAGDEDGCQNNHQLPCQMPRTISAETTSFLSPN